MDGRGLSCIDGAYHSMPTVYGRSGNVSPARKYGSVCTTAGDSTNDLPMFQTAAHSVCMGSGMEEAKQAAEYVTAPLLEDGVEKAMKHYGRSLGG